MIFEHCGKPAIKEQPRIETALICPRILSDGVLPEWRGAGQFTTQAGG